MIFHIPHASTVIPPAERKQILLSGDALSREVLVMTDHYTDDLFGVFATPDDSVIKAEVSRLVVDVERFADDSQEQMSNIGMGVIYTSTSQLERLREPPGPSERETLLDAYYTPHHRALAQAVQSELDSEKFMVFVLDCHSFPSAALPYETHHEAERPDFCIGTDSFHTPEDLVELVVDLLQARGYTVDINYPFAGSIVPMDYYQTDESIASLMIEINRSLYMDELTGEKGGTYIKTRSVIGEVVELIRLYTENEGDLASIVKEQGGLIAWQDWDSGGAGAGAGTVSLYSWGSKFYSFNDEGCTEYDSMSDALSNCDVLKRTSATKSIHLSDELMGRQLTEDEIQSYQSMFDHTIQEFLGFGVPDEDDEDYQRWQTMILDSKEIRTLRDVEYWVEMYCSDDFIFFLTNV
jgi:N-formylglutamate amidohydrolase